MEFAHTGKIDLQPRTVTGTVLRWYSIGILYMVCLVTGVNDSNIRKYLLLVLIELILVCFFTHKI
jgi:hypothetical protein